MDQYTGRSRPLSELVVGPINSHFLPQGISKSDNNLRKLSVETTVRASSLHSIISVSEKTGSDEGCQSNEAHFDSDVQNKFPENLDFSLHNGQHAGLKETEGDDHNLSLDKECSDKSMLESHATAYALSVETETFDTSSFRRFRKRHFHGRKWAFEELMKYIEEIEHSNDQSMVNNRATNSNDFLNDGVQPILIVGGRGSGKTTLCRQVLHPDFQYQTLTRRILYSHFTCKQITDTWNPAKFVLRLHRSLLKAKNTIGRHYKKVFQESTRHIYRGNESADMLFEVLIATLNKLEHTAHDIGYCLIVLDGIDQIDSLDIINNSTYKSSSEASNQKHSSLSILELFIRNLDHFPRWIIPIITCIRQNRDLLQHVFPSCKVVCLDDLHKTAVSHDMQQYVFHRLATEKHLHHAFQDYIHSNTLSVLRIKSSGSILYLEIILDAIKEHWISPEHLDDIPGTLNGLFLWLCQYLFVFRKQEFHKNVFSLVQPILELLLSLPCTFTIPQLYHIAKNCKLVSDLGTFLNHLNLIKPLLITLSVEEEERLYSVSYDKFTRKANSKKLHIFHPSFADWLMDVKHCTAEFLCSKEQLKRSIISFDLLLSDVIVGFHETDTPSTFNNMPQTTNSIGEEIDHVVYDEQTEVKPWNQYVATDCSTIAEQAPTACSLILATREEDLFSVRELLASGVDVNQLDEDGWSSLRTASWHGNLEIVELLLSHGADVHLAGADGRTALRAAAWAGHEQIVSRLLQAGAEVDVRDAEGRSPLIAAAYMGHVAIVEILARAGANLNHADEDGRTALHVAAFSVRPTANHNEVVATLLDYGANPNVHDSEGITPLLGAARVGNCKICELCLEMDTDVNQMDKYGNTALSLAILGGHAELVRLLLFWGSSVDAMDVGGRSLVSIAAALGNASIVSELLARGLDEAHRDHGGRTPLHLAAAGSYSAAALDCEPSATVEQYCEVIRILLESGARADEVDNAGKTAIFVACEYEQIEMVKALVSFDSIPSEDGLEASDVYKHVAAPGQLGLSSGINIASLDHQTPLKIAALLNNAELVRVLLAAGADPDHQDVYGRTALYLLALDGGLEMAKLLLHTRAPGAHTHHGALGANPVLADDEGRCPLHVATWQGHAAMVRLLLQAGTPVDIRDREGRTPLQLAAWQGHVEVCQILLTEGNARVDAVCSQGATSLCIAAQEGHLELCAMLLKHGANPFQADDHGRTPYLVALKAGHREICRILGTNFPSDPSTIHHTQRSCRSRSEIPDEVALRQYNHKIPRDTPMHYHLSIGTESRLNEVDKRTNGSNVSGSARPLCLGPNPVFFDETSPYARPVGPLLSNISSHPSANVDHSGHPMNDNLLNRSLGPTVIDETYKNDPNHKSHMYQIYTRHNIAQAPIPRFTGTDQATAAVNNGHFVPIDMTNQVALQTPVISRPTRVHPSTINFHSQNQFQPCMPISGNIAVSHHQDAARERWFTSCNNSINDVTRIPSELQKSPLSDHRRFIDHTDPLFLQINAMNPADQQAPVNLDDLHVFANVGAQSADHDHAIVSPFKRPDKKNGGGKSKEFWCISAHNILTRTPTEKQTCPTSHSKAATAKSAFVSVLGLGCNRIKRSIHKDIHDREVSLKTLNHPDGVQCSNFQPPTITTDSMSTNQHANQMSRRFDAAVSYAPNVHHPACTKPSPELPLTSISVPSSAHTLNHSHIVHKQGHYGII